jgi:hypothetical protein
MRIPVIGSGLVTAALLLTSPQAAYAYEGPWCMHMTVARDTVVARCDMRSYEMCRAEMRSMGGSYCTQNPYYHAQARGEPKRRAKSKPKRAY